MTETTTTTLKLTKSTSTVGIDLGDRESHICVLDEAGQIITESPPGSDCAHDGSRSAQALRALRPDSHRN